VTFLGALTHRRGCAFGPDEDRRFSPLMCRLGLFAPSRFRPELEMVTTRLQWSARRGDCCRTARTIAEGPGAFRLADPGGGGPPRRRFLILEPDALIRSREPLWDSAANHRNFPCWAQRYVRPAQ